MSSPTYDLAQLQDDLKSIYNEEVNEHTILGYNSDNCEHNSVITVLNTNLYLFDQAYQLRFLHQQLKWVVTRITHRQGANREFTAKPKFTYQHSALWVKYLELFQLGLAQNYHDFSLRIPELLDFLFMMDFGSDYFEQERELVKALVVSIWQFLIQQSWSEGLYGGKASMAKIELLTKIYGVELPTK